MLSSDSICELGLCSYLLCTSFGRDHTELPNLIVYGFQCLYVSVRNYCNFWPRINACENQMKAKNNTTWAYRYKPNTKERNREPIWQVPSPLSWIGAQMGAPFASYLHFTTTGQHWAHLNVFPWRSPLQWLCDVLQKRNNTKTSYAFGL
jgi:hypothetical protein